MPYFDLFCRILSKKAFASHDAPRSLFARAIPAPGVEAGNLRQPQHTCEQITISLASEKVARFSGQSRVVEEQT